MSLERAALVAEICGGVAVVVSVIYLAVQLSDNNRLLRSQAHYNALDVNQRVFESLLENDKLATFLQECRTTPREVEDAVWTRCSTYYFMQINGWEYVYYQNIDKAVPPELWIGADGYYSNEAKANPAWIRFWEEAAIGFGEPFRSFVGERIRQNPAFERSM
ncbi:MAG: hypothetical protein R3E84_05750 [Pseudomonadales bacterium]